MARKLTEAQILTKAQEVIHSLVGDAPNPADFPNDYEFACEMFNQVSEWSETIQELAATISALANEEYNNRTKDLRQYESKPGIPLPQYRTRTE